MVFSYSGHSQEIQNGLGYHFRNDAFGREPFLETGKCIFCKIGNVTLQHSSNGYTVGMCEICGTYAYGDIFAYSIKDLTPIELLNCVAETILCNDQDTPPYWVDAEVSPDSSSPSNRCRVIRTLNRVKDRPVQHSVKLEGLMLAIAKSLGFQKPFASTAITFTDLFRLRIADLSEAQMWFVHLRGKDLIQWQTIGPYESKGAEGQPDRIGPVEMTVAGWSYVDSLTHSVNSKDVLVALKYEGDVELIVTNAARAACSQFGFRAFVVKSKEHIGKIDDELIASIRRSKFLIADFTIENAGAYYEAGYASGLDIPVISTCRQDKIREVHFDTNHINHIVWKDEQDLTQKLKNRIEAVIR